MRGENGLSSYTTTSSSSSHSAMSVMDVPAPHAGIWYVAGVYSQGEVSV